MILCVGNLNVCSFTEFYTETSQANETGICHRHDAEDISELFYVSLIISNL